MKNALTLILLFITLTAFAQLTLPAAKTAAEEYNFRSYSYHEQFEGHDGYAAPIILLANGGTVFFGDAEDEKSMILVQLNKEGTLVWQTPINLMFNEMETQSVVHDREGNFYAFVLSYNYSKYRGSTERVIHLDKNGKILWDKTLGDYTLKNNPHCSYIHLLDDGRLALRGHIVTDAAKEGDDPEYHFWQGWLNKKGEWTQEIGKVIDWADPSWKDFFKVEN
jgi:hypothetical protein